MNEIKVSVWLREVGSHTVMGAVFLAHLPEDINVAIEPDRAKLTREGVAVSLPLETMADVEARMKADARGGELKADRNSRELVFTGYEAASSLARLILHSDPGATYGGRGTGFKANVTALEAAGY